MKTLKIAALLVFAVTIAFVSCKKDSTSESKSSILTSKTWKYFSITENGVEMITDCMKDNTIKFLTNGTYQDNPGTILCDSSETTYSGTWALSTDEKNITIDGTDTYSVQISSSQIVVTQTDSTSTFVMTFKPL